MRRFTKKPLDGFIIPWQKERRHSGAGKGGDGTFRDICRFQKAPLVQPAPSRHAPSRHHLGPMCLLLSVDCRIQNHVNRAGEATPGRRSRPFSRLYVHPRRSPGGGLSNPEPRRPAPSRLVSGTARIDLPAEKACQANSYFVLLFRGRMECSVRARRQPRRPLKMCACCPEVEPRCGARETLGQAGERT